MAINKVVLNDEVKLDLSEDTVTPETLAKGVTAHNAAGEVIEGTLEEAENLDEELTEQDELIEQLKTALAGKGTFTLPELENPATEAMIWEGYEAIDASGKILTGTMPRVHLAATQITLDTQTGLITATGNVNATGYIEAEQRSGTKQLPTQAGSTIMPSTAEQVAVPAGTYTLGDIKVAAVSGGGGSSGDIDAMIDRSITSVSSSSVTVGINAFYTCTSLTTASFPNATKVSISAFQGCTALTSVSFPLLSTISMSAFYECAKLQKFDLPVATSIASQVFYACSSLTALIIRTSSVCSLGGTTAFTNTPIKSGTGYIYVPSSLVSTYKSATNWSTYAAQIRAIEDYPSITGG